MDYKNLYFKFANSFKNQEFSDGQYTEFHHIIPRHRGGDNSPDNLVKVSHRQHIFLHKLRWRAFGEIGDKVAFQMMSGQTELARSGMLELSRLAKLGKPLTLEHREKLKTIHKERMQNPLHLEKVRSAQLMSASLKADNAKARSDAVIANAERNTEWLVKSSPRSVYKFISPEGLVFDSPIYAANYYGNVKALDIENWCKRSKYGWKTYPELAKK